MVGGKKLEKRLENLEWEKGEIEKCEEIIE